MILDYLSGPDLITKIHIKERREVQGQGQQ